MVNSTLGREIIIQTLVDSLKPLDYTYALYEGGAVAFGRIDDWSDIDLYMVVDDDKVDDAFAAVERALNSLSPIEQKYEVELPQWPGLYQFFYKLRDTTEYLLIDFVMVTFSSKEKFLEPKIHGDIFFYFNKGDIIRAPQFDRDAFSRRLHDRLVILRAKVNIFNKFVQKELNRENYLEAIDVYFNLTLGTLVEFLRLKYCPTHHDFKMHYIRYDLPAEVVGKLESLYFVKDPGDLQRKYDEATEWLHKVISEFNAKHFSI